MFNVDDKVIIEPFENSGFLTGTVVGTLPDFLGSNTVIYIVLLTTPCGGQKAIISGSEYLQLIKPLTTYPKLSPIDILDMVVLLDNNISVIIESFENDGDNTLFWGFSKDGTEYSFYENQIKAFPGGDSSVA